MRHRLCESRAEIGFEEIADPVEADESCFSGERMNLSRKRHREFKKAGAGRGTSGQAAVVGVKDRTTNKIAARHTPKTGSAHFTSLIAKDAKLGSTVCTDEAATYNVLDPFYGHEHLNRSCGEHDREVAHTNGMELFWSLMKSECTSVCHCMSARYLSRCVQRFAGRHNVRQFDTFTQTEHLAAMTTGSRLVYRGLLAS